MDYSFSRLEGMWLVEGNPLKLEIHHRNAQAARRGCDLLTSFVGFGLLSHLNLEKAGLRVAYTKGMWWKAE